mgnify:FL=1
MNISDFVTIGVIEQFGQSSGYDVVQEAENRKVQLWTGLKTGSIYHSIKKLSESGHIIEVSKTKSGQRPTKTSYSVTQLGRDYFDSLQEKAFKGLFPHFYGFLLGLIFNTRQTPKDIQIFAKSYKKIVEEKLKELIEGQASCRCKCPDSPPILAERLSLYLEQRTGLFNAEKKL